MDVAENQSFYVKVRGKQLGPLTISRVRELVKQGLVNRATPVSSDGQTWRKAAEVAELFAAPRPAEGNSGNPVGMRWYYSSRGVRNGPVDISDIASLLRSGNLTGDDMAWRQGMNEWQQIGLIGELTLCLTEGMPDDSPGGFPSAEGLPLSNPLGQPPRAANPAPNPSRSSARTNPASLSADEAYALGRIRGPALALMISNGVMLVVLLVWLLLILFGFSSVLLEDLQSSYVPEGEIAGFIAGATMYGIQAVIALLIGIVVVIGANRMLKLKSYGFGFTAAILAMIPCVSPCCLLGIPFGIWALVVLSDPRVKDTFT